MAGFADYVTRMRSALKLTIPELDTSVGTVSRKMIDAFCEILQEVSIDQYINDYQYDIDSLSGQALDDMVRLFGFSRLPARRSTGEVTIERGAGLRDKDILIPMGTQFATDGLPPVIVATVIPAVMLIGDSSITIPAQAVVPGANGNIVAHALKRVASPISGIAGFDNLVAFTGGSDAESDQALRTRFKKSIFRNLAGTEDMALGVSLENLAVLAANVIGPLKRHREQIEIVGGQGDSTIVNAKYLYDPASYAGTVAFGSDLESDQFLQLGVHWTWSSEDNPDGTVFPRITAVDSDACPDGIYELDFAYVPRASRNDIPLGITNRVDIWTDGTDETEATETARYVEASVFTDSDGDPLYRGNFRREDETLPVEGNLFIPLHFSPIINGSVNDQIVINSIEYEEGVDYWAVNDITSEGMSPQSKSGLEWNVTDTVKDQPDDNTLFANTYTYNAVPLQVQKAIQNWRLLTQDWWVHAAIPMFMNIHLTVILNEGANAVQVRNDLIPLLRNHFATLGFNNVLQASDIEQVARQIGGIDAVRFTRYDEVPTVPETFLDGAIDDTQTTITVTDTTGFEVGDLIHLDLNTLTPEHMIIVDVIDGTDMEVVRGYGGTAFAHLDVTEINGPRNYGIQRSNSQGYVLDEDQYWDFGHERVLDVFIDDDSTAKLNDILLTVKAQNTWGGIG